LEDTTAIYTILKRIRERKEELKTIIAAGIHSFDEYNKCVGEYKGYNIMEQEIQDLQKKEDGDTET
jgi:choline kinase